MRMHCIIMLGITVADTILSLVSVVHIPLKEIVVGLFLIKQESR